MIDDVIAPDPPSTSPADTRTVTLGPAEYRARCPRCGTWTSTVADRRTAVQAALACCTTPTNGVPT